MPDVLIRDVSPESIAAVKRRAARNGRSAGAELRLIVDEAARAEQKDDWWAEATRLRESTAGRYQTPSEVLIREGRDERDQQRDACG